MDLNKNNVEVIILVFIICGIVSILKVSGMSMTLKSTFSNTQQNEVKITMHQSS